MELVKHALREVVRVISSVTKEHPRVPWVIVRGTLEYAMFGDIRISTVEIFQLPLCRSVLFNVGGIVANYPTDLTYHWRNTFMHGDLVPDIQQMGWVFMTGFILTILAPHAKLYQQESYRSDSMVRDRFQNKIAVDLYLVLCTYVRAAK